MRKLIGLLLFLLLSVSTSTFAASARMDVESKKLYNEVMNNIFEQILSLKSEYDGLDSFQETNRTLNKYGISQISYKSNKLDYAIQKVPYGFDLEIDKMDDIKRCPSDKRSFNIGFPVLGVKFSGCQNKVLRFKHYDIQNLLEKYGQELWDYQQKFIPYQLSIVPSKFRYSPGEEIEFTVSLKNLTQKNLSFKNLDNQTLKVLYNGKPWGDIEASTSHSGANIVLEPYESISKKFRSTGFDAEQSVEIYVSYSMTYKSVNPSAWINVNIVDK